MTHAPAPQAPLVPATPRGAATRRKLLDAAEAEFGEKGFHAASVSSITTRAEVGQGTFYLYFHSKEEIFVTLVREIGHALRAELAGATRDRPDRLAAERAGLEAFFRFAYEHPGLYRIVQECQFVDEPVYREYYEKLASGYRDALAKAESRGEIRPGDAATRAWALMGVGHFVGLKHCLWERRVPDAAALDTLMDLIRNGIAASAP
jgi:AcrR family transcriptional regulator